MVRSIEYLKDSKRFDIGWGSMVRYSIFDDRISNCSNHWIFEGSVTLVVISTVCCCTWPKFIVILISIQYQFESAVDSASCSQWSLKNWYLHMHRKSIEHQTSLIIQLLARILIILDLEGEYDIYSTPKEQRRTRNTYHLLWVRPHWISLNLEIK